MNLENLRNRTRILLGRVSSTNYTDDEINTAINNYYYQAIAIGAMSMGGWEVSGAIETANLVADQKEYVLPTNVLALLRIEINYEGEDLMWNLCRVFNLKEKHTALSNDTTTGTSTEIDLYDNSIFLKTPPATGSTGGLKIYYIKRPDTLSGDTDLPDLPDHLTDFLIYGACLEYSFIVNDDAMSNKFKALLNEDGIKIERFYADRAPVIRTRFKPRNENYI